eukprot:2907363-Alexandrium_andersonii.AAC.1
MWTELPNPAKTLMVATNKLKETRGDMTKLYESMEAVKVLDFEKRPWKAKSLVGGALFTWNGDWCLQDSE